MKILHDVLRHYNIIQLIQKFKIILLFEILFLITFFFYLLKYLKKVFTSKYERFKWRASAKPERLENNFLMGI